MKIAITGGIGAGKSVVCNLLRSMGHPVYDTDSEAKRIMDADPAIHQAIASRICPEAIIGEQDAPIPWLPLREAGIFAEQSDFVDDLTCVSTIIDRKRLAKEVFSDSAKLQTLNEIVHGAVIADFLRWAAVQGEKPVFVETALLYESGLDAFVDAIWWVDAPIDLRIERVMARSQMTRAEVESRIRSQQSSPASQSKPFSIILNDNRASLIGQTNSLLSSIS